MSPTCGGTNTPGQKPGFLYEPHLRRHQHTRLISGIFYGRPRRVRSGRWYLRRRTILPAKKTLTRLKSKSKVIKQMFSINTSNRQKKLLFYKPIPKRPVYIKNPPTILWRDKNYCITAYQPFLVQVVSQLCHWEIEHDFLLIAPIPILPVDPPEVYQFLIQWQGFAPK